MSETELLLPALFREADALAYAVGLSKLRRAQEWTVLDRTDPPKGKKGPYERCVDLARFVGTSIQDHSRLGLHWLGDQLRPSHFTGAVWLEKPKRKDGGIPFVVASPKIDRLDQIAMFIRVASSTQYARVAGRVFDCEPDEPPISGNDLPDTTLLQVAVYLKELAQFCQRNVRYGFVRRLENLVGRAKGKIVVPSNQRSNVQRGRLDRVFCQFDEVSIDTNANQILKSALSRCYRYTNRQNNRYSELSGWARQSEAFLAQVREREIGPRDWLGIVYCGLMARYRRPHKLAKMILARLRSDGRDDKTDGRKQITETVPFWLNMNELFEAYVGALLGSDYQAQWERQIGSGDGGFALSVRPDYVSTRLGVIVDAKYKEVITPSENEMLGVHQSVFMAGWSGQDVVRNAQGNDNSLSAAPQPADVYQVIAYAVLLESLESPVDRVWDEVVIAVPGKPKGKNELMTTDWKGAPCLMLRRRDRDRMPLKVVVWPCDLPKKD